MRIALDGGNVIRVEKFHEIDAASLKFEQTGRVIDDGAKDHPIEQSLLTPIVGVALYHDAIVLAPFSKAECPCAHRVFKIIVPMLFDRRWAGDPEHWHGQIGEKGG